MPSDSQAPLRKRVFGKGLVTYKQDGLLCFDLTIREKTYHEEILLMNKTDTNKKRTSACWFSKLTLRYKWRDWN